VSEPELDGADVLTDRLADRVAGRVLDRIAPGHGPMIIPEWAADLFGRWAEMGGGRYPYYAIIHGPRADMLGINVTAMPNKTLSLRMELNSLQRIWDGVLRGPSGS
jgi:hypothetical protein